MYPPHMVGQVRGARRGRQARLSVERLEGRALLAMLSFQTATVKPDGRVVELVFSGPKTDGAGVPEHAQAWDDGLRLTTNLGTQLEPLGTVVTRQSDELVWTVTFLVSDAQDVITFDTASVTMSAPERLLEDDHGNWTEAIDTVLAQNMSLVDADGFTTDSFQRGVGGVTLYVSSTHGSDSRTFAQAQNPATPMKSAQWAITQLRLNGQDGRGAAVRFLRGDVFAQFSLMLGGQDARHPLVLEDYWFDYGDGRTDPNIRPEFQADWSKGYTTTLLALRGGGLTGEAAAINNVVIRRLSFRAINRPRTALAGQGLYLLSGGKNWTLDDVVVTNHLTNIVFQGAYAPFVNTTVLRSIVTDGHLAVALAGVGGSGFLSVNTKGMLISQSTFDRNGRMDHDLSGRNMFSHNIYISEQGNGPTTLWGNYIGRGGSHGIHLRSGGVVAYNYFGRDAMAVEMSNVGGVMTRNVVENGEDISPALPRGYGLIMSTTYGSSISTVIEQNIMQNSTSVTATPWMAQQTGTHTIENGVIRNNMSYSTGASTIRYSGTPSVPLNISMYGNSVDAPSSFVLRIDYRPTNVGWGWLHSDHNTYASRSASRPFLWPAITNFDGWKSASGQDLHSSQIARVYPLAYVKIGNYSASVGGSSRETDYVNQIRGRGMGRWSSLNDMQRLYQYFAANLRTANLPSLGDGPHDYMGASDYRPTAPDLVHWQDTGPSNTDNITRVNTNLMFEVSNSRSVVSLDLLRDGIRVARVPGDATKAVTMVDPSILADGTYTYVTRQLGFDNVWIYGRSVRVTIDRGVPTTPEAPSLVSVVDSQPILDVATSETGGVVHLMRRGVGGSMSRQLEEVASRTGSGTIQDPATLDPGNYEYIIYVTDRAGNSSNWSSKLVVTII